MKITGKRQTYDVKWSQYGWSYAKAFIEIPGKILGIIPFKKRVWLSTKRPMIYAEAERMIAEEAEKWFREAVADYEARIESWENFRKTES